MDRWAGQTEQQLIAATRTGNPEAFGELVRRCQQAVFNTTLRLTGDQQEALDLAQEAFVRAYRALDSFDVARPFEPWVRRIAANLALNWLERRRVPSVTLVHARAGEDEPAERALPDLSTEPERLYLAGERNALLRQALLALPPHYRAVIELRHFQDLSYEQIATTLGLPLSDVKSYLFRARQMLRHRLEGEA